MTFATLRPTGNGLSGKLSNWRFCIVPKGQDLDSLCYETSVLLYSNLQSREAPCMPFGFFCLNVVFFECLHSLHS